MAAVSNELNQEIMRTQQALNYVRRPQLSVKLLSKPPFKVAAREREYRDFRRINNEGAIVKS